MKQIDRDVKKIIALQCIPEPSLLRRRRRGIVVPVAEYLEAGPDLELCSKIHMTYRRNAVVRQSGLGQSRHVDAAHCRTVHVKQPGTGFRKVSGHRHKGGKRAKYVTAMRLPLNSLP